MVSPDVGFSVTRCVKLSLIGQTIGETHSEKGPGEPGVRTQSSLSQKPKTKKGSKKHRTLFPG